MDNSKIFLNVRRMSDHINDTENTELDTNKSNRVSTSSDYKGMERDKGKKLITSPSSILGCLTAFGVLVMYLERNSLNSMIVCMVAEQPSHINLSQVNVNETQCNQSVEVGYYPWDEDTKSGVLGSAYIGYSVMQLPMGYLASKYGGYTIFVICNAVSSILTILSPFFTHINGWAFFCLRIAVGVFQAGVWPSVFTLASQWLPNHERGRYFGLVKAGCSVGTTFAVLWGGLFCKWHLCTQYYTRGWAMLFFLIGVIGLIWVFAWITYALQTSDSLDTFSEIEMSYIEEEVFLTTQGRNRKIPWSEIIHCKIIWVLLVTQVFFAYGLFAQWILIPSYMKEVLTFEYDEIGVYSALPHLSCWFGCMLNGTISDCLIARRCLSASVSRKAFHFIGSFGTGISLLCLSYISPDNRYLAVALFCLGGFFSSFTMSGGYFICTADVSGPYTSAVFGIGNTLTSMAGFIAPLSAASILKRRKYDHRRNWNCVFMMFSIALMFSGIMFAIFSSSEPQVWSLHESLSEKSAEDESTFADDT